jgi:hypothetical protein
VTTTTRLTKNETKMQDFYCDDNLLVFVDAGFWIIFEKWATITTLTTTATSLS